MRPSDPASPIQRPNGTPADVSAAAIASTSGASDATPVSSIGN